MEVYSWEGHFDTVFLESDGILYYTDFELKTSGCIIIAYDLRNRRKLWRAELKAIGDQRTRVNTIRMERVDGKVLAIYGDESFGRYLEYIDVHTGKTVGHRVFPKKRGG